MNRTEKKQSVSQITELLNSKEHVYLTDILGLDAGATHELRKVCAEKDIPLQMVKNTLLKIALEQSEKEGVEPLFDVLKNSTAIMLSDVASEPAKVIKDYIEKTGNEKPVLKAAYVEQEVYVGAEQLETLVAIKSKDELLGEIITLLQSPANNVVSALQSGKNKLAGLVETLSKKESE